MRFLRICGAAAVELDSRAAGLDERHRFTLCRPDALVDLLEHEDMGFLFTTCSRRLLDDWR
jgi:hypothetical protein